ncbi:hypothetical protein ACFL43_00990 [Thermodesulfobacteriota bacterium]
MPQLTRRTFTSFAGGGAFSFLALLSMPAAAMAFFDKVKKDAFLKRDDLGDAIKSYYMTYNCTSPYPHKFNEVITKAQLRSLQFFIDKGLEKKYVAHYITTMEPVLTRIQQAVQKDGEEKALSGMFEETSCSYQLFERITVTPGMRSFPCPYKELLVQCKKYLGTFTLAWNDVCTKLCTPVWTGFGDKIGVTLKVTPGETCTATLVPKKIPQEEKRS